MNFEELAELTDVADAFAAGNTTLEPATKAIHAMATANGWAWLRPDDRQEFNRRALRLLRAYALTKHSAGRLEQLLSDGFNYWVLRADIDCPEHMELDGLVLPASDPARQRFTPPFGWDCACYIVGANSESGAARLGGDLSKIAPSISPIDELWRTGPPSFAQLVAAMSSE